MANKPDVKVTSFSRWGKKDEYPLVREDVIVEVLLDNDGVTYSRVRQEPELAYAGAISVVIDRSHRGLTGRGPGLSPNTVISRAKSLAKLLASSKSTRENTSSSSMIFSTS